MPFEMPDDGSIRSGTKPGKADERMKQVVTYQLAYITSREVSLCAECVERDNHDCGVLGSVQHGLHDGECDGRAHKRKWVIENPETAHVMGTYEGADEDEALDALARDAGYESYATSEGKSDNLSVKRVR